MKREKMSKSAASGIVALIFLIVGFQAAIFFEKIIKISKEQKDGEIIVNNLQDSSVVVYAGVTNASASETRGQQTREKKSRYTENRTALGGYKEKDYAESARLYESFEFNPNDVSINDLMRLGLSTKQAESIDNYRNKGGTFRKKEDFARMYVVSDTLYQRLEKFINIPKIELNEADTTALKSLPGIGSYYAKKIIKYRETLGGFVELEQLLEIDGFTKERFDGLKEYTTVDTSKLKPFGLWEMSEETLSAHPYIGSGPAKGIIRFKACNDSSMWNVENLVGNGILSSSNSKKLLKYKW